MAKITRHVLAGGKLGARLQTRSDMEQYYTGGKEMLNFISTPQGGIKRRPGVALAGTIISTTDPEGNIVYPKTTRSIPFQSTNGDNLTVLFIEYEGDIPGGGVSNFTQLEVRDLSTQLLKYVASIPYTPDEFDDIQSMNINDSLFLAHPSHPIKRLHRVNTEDWTFSDWKYTVPPSLPTNGNTSKQVSFEDAPWDSEVFYNPGDVVLTSTEASGSAYWIGGSKAADMEFMEEGSSFNLDERWSKERKGSHDNEVYYQYYPYIYIAVDDYSEFNVNDSITFVVKGVGGRWNGTGTILDKIMKTDSDSMDRYFLKLDIEIEIEFIGAIVYGYTSTAGYISNAPLLTVPSTQETWFTSDSATAIEYNSWTHTRYMDFNEAARECWYLIFGKDDPDDGTVRKGGFAIDNSTIYITGDATSHYVCKEACINIDTDNTTYWDPATGDVPASTYSRIVFTNTDPLVSGDVERPFFAAETSEISDDGEFTAVGESDPLYAYGTVEFSTEGGLWSGEIQLQVQYPEMDDWTTIGSIVSKNKSYNGSLERVIEQAGAKVRVKMVSITEGTCYWKLSIPESGPSVYTIKKVYSSNTGLVKLEAGAPKKYTTWQWSFGAFGKSVGYPSCFTIYEERLYLAGGKDPSTFYGSMIGDWSNFGLGALETSAISFNIASNHLASIKWMSPFYGSFIIGTDVGVWSATNKSTTKSVVSAINPPELKKVTPDAVSSITPIETDGSLVFITSDLKMVKAIYQDTYTTTFTSSDLSILYPEVAGSGFKRMVVSQTPYPVIWFLTKDDELRSLTLNRAQSITGWADHIIVSGTRMDIGIIRNNEGEDVLIVTGINDIVNGTDTLYIGKMNGNPGTDQVFGWNLYWSVYTPTSLAQDQQTLEESVVRISNVTLHYAKNEFPITYLAPESFPAEDELQYEVDWEEKEGPAFSICKMDTGNTKVPNVSIVAVAEGELELTGIVVDIEMKTSKGK